MNFTGLNVGFALTGSFCTLNQVFPHIQNLIDLGANILPIVSETVKTTDTRFGSCEYFLDKFESMTGKKIISSIKEAEPIGPNKLLDILIIAPCTGNTIAKIANGITDTAVTMAAKAHLRNGRPLLIAMATNDALGNSAKNIGQLLNCKNVFFVPYRQDDPINKNNSMVSDFNLIADSAQYALGNTQIQPIILGSEI
jgi:dipicolinate synthase subunit B